MASDPALNQSAIHVNLTPVNDAPPAPRSRLRRFAQAFVGYGAFEKDATDRAKVPEGFEVRYTMRGTAYLVKKTESAVDPEDEAAANEYKKKHLGFLSTIHQIGDEFGLGYFLYFNFSRFLLVSNFVLFLITVINFAAHIVTDGLGGASLPQQVLYISTYSSGLRPLWTITTIAAIVVWFLLGPIYTLRTRLFFKGKGVADFEDTYGEDENVIQENLHVRASSRANRLVLSYIIFGLVLLLSGAGSFFIIVAQDNAIGAGARSSTLSLLTALAVSLFLLLINFIWFGICNWLTSKLERHTTWTGQRKHNTLKYYFFRMFNVVIMFFSRYLVRQEAISKALTKAGSGSALDSLDECGLVSLGDQFLVFMIAELTLTNAYAVLWPLVYVRLTRSRAMKSDKPDFYYKPEFDVSEQYLKLLYRQFVTYLALPIFPLAPLLAILVNVPEYFLDKLKILRICKRPKHITGSQKTVLSFFLFTNAIAALVCFPFGAVWVLGGFYFSDHCEGTIYG